MRNNRIVIAAAVVGVVGVVSGRAVACESHAIAGMFLNVTGAHGTSTNATVNANVSGILADVQQVRYDANNSYITSNGIPSHAIGPWPGNPNQASSQTFTFRVPLSPQEQSGTKTSARILGPIGFMVNGVPFFDATDGRSYNNQNIWHQNANVVEAPSFDAGKGHPQQTGMYHYHQQPALLRQQFGDDGSHHSPLLGFAFDGFPVYGPYGYANTDGTGGIDRMEPSYRLRNLTTRTNGPAVSTTFPLGYYVEDYEYVAGVGDLDAYNGRFAITPEYPAGTYAYFTTVDASGNAAYPYIVGTSFYGVLQNDNRTQPVSVPAGVSTFTAAASGTWSNANGGEWCTNANWAGGTAPAGVATMASFGEMSGKSDVAVEVDSPLRVGTMNFSGASKYAIGGIGMITVVGTTASNVNVGSGAHVITAPVALGKATTFNVSSGASLDVNNLESVGVAITKSGAGTLKLGRLSGTALTVSQGTVQMPAGGSMLKVNTLSIAPGAKLDLGDRDLVVNNGSFTTIRSLVIQGANGSEGITSSSDQSCILALFDNALVGASTWELQAIGANAVVGKYTYFGDVNLDGQVSGDDYTVIDATLNSDPAPGLEWLSGDMNIDGIVTGDDYTVIDANLGLGAGNALVMSGLTAVPDPVMGAACLIAPLLGRRRRCA